MSLRNVEKKKYLFLFSSDKCVLSDLNPVLIVPT